MDLTLVELAALKETPFPGDAVSSDGTVDSRSAISFRAAQRLENPDTTAALRAIDQLAARGYVERVSIGFFRRTFEGQAALVRNTRALQALAHKLAV